MEWRSMKRICRETWHGLIFLRHFIHPAFLFTVAKAQTIAPTWANAPFPMHREITVSLWIMIFALLKPNVTYSCIGSCGRLIAKFSVNDM